MVINSTQYKRFGSVAYEMYVNKGESALAVANHCGIGQRTVQRWIEKLDWNIDRDKIKMSSVAIVTDLDKLLAEIRVAYLAEGKEVAVKLEGLDLIDKIMTNKARITGEIDRVPIALDLIDDLCRYARREADHQIKDELWRVIDKWAVDIRSRYRKAGR